MAMMTGNSGTAVNPEQMAESIGTLPGGERIATEAESDDAFRDACVIAMLANVSFGPGYGPEILSDMAFVAFDLADALVAERRKRRVG